MDHDLNVIGALVVVLGDRMRDATEDASGMGGALPAALAALHEWAGGRTIDTLAGGLRLSHSRTVRVIDRLEAAGLATARARPGRRRAACSSRLTPAGQRRGRARARRARGGARRRRSTRSRRDERRELAALAEAAARPGDDGPARRGGDLPAVRRARVRPRRRALSRSRGRPTRPRRLRPERRQSGGGTAVSAVVVPDDVLHVVGEQPARGYVVVADRGYGRGRGLCSGCSTRTSNGSWVRTLTGVARVCVAIRSLYSSIRRARCGAPRRARGGGTRIRARCVRSGTARWPVHDDRRPSRRRACAWRGPGRARAPGGAARGRAPARTPCWSRARARSR